jgi:hypothetical protein
MKEMILDHKRKPGHARALRGRTAGLAAGLALAAAGIYGTSVLAKVYDDFENPTNSQTLWTGHVWYGTGGQTVTNGRVRLYVTPNVSGGGAFSFLQSVRTWTLREGRTLEFKADLLSSNGDGALGYIAFHLGDGNSGYMLMVDEDTIALHKRSNPLTLFLLTNGAPVKVSNVKLVLSMTGVQSGVLLKVRVLDNDNAGAVVFEREYCDTAGADPMERGTDDPPESFLGQTSCLYLSLFRDPGYFDPDVTLPPLAKAEVVWDNAEVLEYDVPSLQIANSVLLTWSANTEEEQIVVIADSVTSTNWTPCPQPIFTGSGGLSVAVPITANQQFFKLVPGRQFVDNFSDTWGPFTNRDSYMEFVKDPGEEWYVTNGVLRLAAVHSAYAGFLLAPLGTNAAAKHEDFFTSADILDWVTNGTNWSLFSLLGRYVIGTPTSGNGYGGLLSLNSGGIAGRVKLIIGNGSAGVDGPTFDMAAHPPPYRLEFSGVGNPICQLRFRVLSLTTGELIAEQRELGTGYTSGLPGIWVNTRNEAGDTFAITADNFFVTGTKP